MMFRACSILVLAFAGLAVPLPACSVSSPPEETGAGGSASTGTMSIPGEGSYGAGPCAECVGAACQAEIAACEASESCSERWTCVLSCPVAPSGDVDPACELGCPTINDEAGMKASLDLLECRRKGAGLDCTACGGVGDPMNPIFHQQCGPSEEMNPCWICEDEKCCDTYQSCANDPGCTAIAGCVNACANDATDAKTFVECSDQCYHQSPASYPLFADRLSCLDYHCSDACGGATDPCSSCSQQFCADEDAACARDLPCKELGHCLTGCAIDDAKCRHACASTAGPEAATLMQAWIDCAESMCPYECE